jgi:hypothetical protein
LPRHTPTRAMPLKCTRCYEAPVDVPLLAMLLLCLFLDDWPQTVGS